MKYELSELQTKEAHAKKQLEEETLLRSDAENRLQSAEDQLKFLKDMHARVSTYCPGAHTHMYEYCRRCPR